jgi:kynurenine--oxoglutarate transaminase/cysteine-S-conjugate beta-lyase/glutamine--phenylpyruvate transaminase
MWERTLTINSGGKTFSNTGWRIGWTIGPADLLWAMEVSLFSNILSVPTPTQLAFAIGIEIENERLGKNNSYYLWVRNEAKRMRDRFIKIFNSTGIEAVVPNAGYFINADFTKIINRLDLSKENESRVGFKFPFWLLKQKV